MAIIEPELFKYEDLEDCCRFLVLLDRCLTNYPREKSLITRMVKTFLKLAWMPIKMCKHQGSHLWPDRLEPLGEFPPPYAKFLGSRDHKVCGYGGQGIYVYDITIQVVVWRAVRATNRLLNLVSSDPHLRGWMVRQSLDDKAIRNRTIKAFLHPGTDTSQRSFAGRFISKIRGHVREPFLEKRACTIAIPSLVDDFFFDDNNKPMSAWKETLKYCDTLSNSTKAQTSDTWASFMHYQLAFDEDRRKELRERLEASAYSVGLFASDLVTPSSHGLCTPYWDIVTHLLSADYTHTNIPKIEVPPTRTDGARGSTPPQESPVNAGTTQDANSIVGVRQDGKKGVFLYMTTEDLRQVNDPPSYGERYWFRDPLFMKYKRDKFEMDRKSIESFLEPGYSFARGDIEGNWCFFGENDEEKNKFLESIKDTSNYGWGDKKNELIQPNGNNPPDRTHGSEALLKLQEQRDREKDRKRVIIMEDCAIEHLISLMANLDYQEACHINQFLLRLARMDSHEMIFQEKTIMPDNLWITEFNINFITTQYRQDVESPPLPNYFQRRWSEFLRIKNTRLNRIMVEASMGFRFIGDLHDQFWTCYVFYNFGRQELIPDPRARVERIDSYETLRQRKCLEGFLVRQALDLVLSQTENVLKTITTKSMGEGDKSQKIFIPLLTEADLRGENYFKTMNKNSVFYPWLLEAYGALRGKCKETSTVAMQWILAEEKRKYKPRWSEKDQRKFGEEIVQNRADVEARCAKLKKMAKNLQERIDRIKTLKESLSSELELREARTSTQLARTINLFAVITAIYLPLTFSTSIVAIQDLHWKYPAKALVRIMLAVASSTLILLMNLSSLRRNLAALKRWAQSSIRNRMKGVPESKKTSRPTHQDKRPGWKYWKKKACSLHEAEKRSALLTDNDIHCNESDWWYWYFTAIYIVTVVPVQELTFIIRTLRGQKIENAGPLKKLVRLSGFPIWALHLALVYVIILAGYAFLSLVRLVHHTVVWLWTGNATAKNKTALEEAGKSSMSEPEDDAECSESESDSTRKDSTYQDSAQEDGTQQDTQKDAGLVDWLMKPAKMMMLLMVKEALQPKKKERESDPENQGTPMDH